MEAMATKRGATEYGAEDNSGQESSTTAAKRPAKAQRLQLSHSNCDNSRRATVTEIRDSDGKNNNPPAVRRPWYRGLSTRGDRYWGYRQQGEEW